MGSNQPRNNSFSVTVPGVPAQPRLPSFPINVNSTGDNLIIPGIVNQTIRIFRLFFTVSADTLITFKDDIPTTFSGPISLVQNGSIFLEFDGEPWYTSNIGAGFVINQSASAQLSGTIYFIQS